MIYETWEPVDEVNTVGTGKGSKASGRSRSSNLICIQLGIMDDGWVRTNDEVHGVVDKVKGKGIVDILGSSNCSSSNTISRQKNEAYYQHIQNRGQKTHVSLLMRASEIPNDTHDSPPP